MKIIPCGVVAGMLATSLLCAVAAADDTARLKSGAAVYEKWCATCHSDGHNFAGTVALQAKYKGAVPPVLMQRTDLTAEFIAHFVRNGFSIMPFFRKTEISDEQLADLTAYMTQPKKK